LGFSLLLASMAVLALLSPRDPGPVDVLGEVALQEVAFGVESHPTNWEGRQIPQLLFDASRQGVNTMLRGTRWEPMDPLPGRPSTKGPLDPQTTALLIIDMQPLFYDTSSPWGSRHGLEASAMSKVWPRQLALAKRLAEFTGRNDSVFLTRYLLPDRAEQARGIMRHYYRIESGGGITREALTSSGANVTFLLDTMPALHGLVASGAQVSTKYTAGAFGPSSTLPSQLDNHFRDTGNVTRTLLITGVETDYCVISTILSAIDHYYRIVVVTDAITSSQLNSGQAQLDYTLRRFDHMVDLMTTADLIALLSTPSLEQGIDVPRPTPLRGIP